MKVHLKIMKIHQTEQVKYNRVWKVRRVFKYLSNIYSTLYYSTEDLVVVEVIVKF